MQPPIGYTESMNVLLHLPPARTLAVNYIGGIGYYTLHLAWMLLVFILSQEVLQYIVFQGQPVPYVSETGAAASASSMAPTQVPIVLSWLLALCAGLVVMLFVVLVPYWLGYISRPIPRWLLRQTNWQDSPIFVHRTKQLLVLFVIGSAVLALYKPAVPPLQNLAFFIVIGLLGMASACFWLQHRLAARWRLPQRSIY